MAGFNRMNAIAHRHRRVAIASSIAIRLGASIADIFGVITASALAVVLASGLLLPRSLPSAAASCQRKQRMVDDFGQCPSSVTFASIQIAMAIIIRFSVRDTKPRGTLLSPPTQAHFNSLLSM